ncbi:unnamed protein product [Somion occarium]|uniref:Uncharacterized protein n=1 Tax=Somion occarium TaxID=3059160 RepID=A0ABP1CM60_9APHY
MSSSGTFTNFLHSFGHYTIFNPSVPLLPGFPPPPSTPTIPVLGPSVSDGELHFSVIENPLDSSCTMSSKYVNSLSFTPAEYTVPVSSILDPGQRCVNTKL